jgi:peptidoglycan hydrolase CwlO-like protein
MSIMEKQVKKEDKFRATEVGALIEAIRFEIKPVLEAIPDIQKKLDRLFEKVEENSEKIDGNTGKIEINRVLITRVLEELKSKVDRKEFDILEKKVASLTN